MCNQHDVECISRARGLTIEEISSATICPQQLTKECNMKPNKIAVFLAAITLAELISCINHESIESASDGESTSSTVQLMKRAHPITSGVGIARSILGQTWVFLEWGLQDRLASGERAVISSDRDGSGDIIVDNGLYVNGNHYPTGFGGTLSDPMAHLGQAASTCYTAVPPLDVTGDARADGRWFVQLLDSGYTYTSSPLYLVLGQ
jgi:hypothetical protein